MGASGAASAAPPVRQTAAYAPGSVGYYSVPALSYFPAYSGTPYFGFGYSPYPYSYVGNYGIDYSYQDLTPPANYSGNPVLNPANPPYSTGYGPAMGPVGWGRSPMSSAREVVPLPRSEVADIRVQVPPDADVWIEGVKTKQKGSDREFQSPPLAYGVNYWYEIHAEWKSNGQVVGATQIVNVQAGDRMNVTFRLGNPLRPNPTKPQPAPEEEEQP